MKRLTVILGTLFLWSGMAVGQPLPQKQSKQVEPVISAFEMARVTRSFKRPHATGLESSVPVAEENKASVRQVLQEGAVALSGKSEIKAEPLQPPYRCTFDYKKVLEEEWIVTDRDGDEKSWVYATAENYPTFDGNDESGFLAVSYNETVATADYLITKSPVRMAAGKAYVAFHHASRGGKYTERLRVYYSEAGNDDVSKMTLIGELEDSTLVWKFSVLPFEIKSAGDYYFCFLHCSDADQYNMYLDNVEIGEGVFSGEPNLKVEQVMLPFSACGLGTAEKIGVLVTNVGTASVTEMELSYAVNDGTPVEEKKNETLAPCETRMFYFEQPADFSEEGVSYAVSVSVAVLESDGEREEQLGDNTKIGSVTHFLPFESFPFVVNTELEADLAQLGYDPLMWVYDEEYGELHAMDTLPLMTRCMVLEANQKYRFTLDYLAGMAYWGLFAMPEDFDVVYGQAGTPVATWEVLKSYKNVYTNEALVYDEIWFTNKVTGNYSFAIVPKISQYGSYNASLYIAGIGVEKVAEHDVKMVGYLPSIGAKTPARHAVAPQFEVAVGNRGSNDEDDVKVKVWNGDAEVGVSQGQTVKSADTAYYMFAGRLPEPTVGDEVTLTFEAVITSEDAEPGNNMEEWSFTATDELYAFDMDLAGYYDGIGTQQFIFGQIFTLAETDTLTSMQFGWYDLSKLYSWGFAVGLEIYPLNEAGETGNCLLAYEFERSLGGMQMVDIPARVLPAGRYFVAVRQLSADNIALGFDDNPAGVFYALLNGRLEPMRGYGYIAMRAVFGKVNKVVERDIELLAIEKPKDKGVFSANEPIEVNYRNNGLETMEVEFKCAVDGKGMESKKVSVPGYGMGTVVFAADLSAVGKHEISVEVSTEGDEVLDNNTLKTTVECLAVDPYVMDFELNEDFSIENLIPWRTLDNDGGNTYGFSSTEWPNAYMPQAFIAFNPKEAGLGNLMETCKGDRMGCVFASVDVQNDDWLISPKLRLPTDGAEVRFFVKSLMVSESEAYTEEYNVLISTTTDDLGSFVPVGPTLQAPDEWTEVVVDLAMYNGMEVYVAIQCVSDDQFVFMIDEIRVSNPLGLERIEDLSAYVQSYPNPVAEQWTVTAYGLDIDFVEISNMMGETVYRSLKNLKAETYRVNVSGFVPGLYVARVHTNAGVQIVKIVVR